MSEAANKISQLRKERGFNQKKFSELIGVSHPSLIKFEKGETDKIPIGVAKKMASLLKVSVGELFSFDDYIEREKELKKIFDDLENDGKKLVKYITEKDKYILLLDRKHHSCAPCFLEVLRTLVVQHF
jgi:transcriptional regulator with XRE-family HTH domain